MSRGSVAGLEKKLRRLTGIAGLAAAILVLLASGGRADLASATPASSASMARACTSHSCLLGVARRYLRHHRCPGIRDASDFARRLARNLRVHPSTIAAASQSTCNPTRAARSRST